MKHCLMTAILFVALLSLPSVSRSESDIGIREIKMGMSMKEVIPFLKLPICRADRCSATLPIKDRPVLATLQFHEGVLDDIRLEFKQLNYEAIKNALTEKYGAPTKTRIEPWMNKRGTKLDNEVSYWLLPSGTISLSYIGRKMDFSEVMMTSKAAEARITEDMKGKKDAPGF